MQKKFKENKSESAPVVSSLPQLLTNIRKSKKGNDKNMKDDQHELQDGNKPNIFLFFTYSNYQLVLWLASMPWSPMQIN